MTDNLFIGEIVRLTALDKIGLHTIKSWYGDGGVLRLYNSDPVIPCTEESLNK